MKKVFIFLTNGFEEIEALATIDILRRGGVEIQSVSITDSQTVTGGHQIPVVADCMFADITCAHATMLILPGGTVKINEHEGLKREVLEFAQQGKRIAAICAAPMVLGGLGLLKGKKATCYPGFEQYLADAQITGNPIEIDGNITTGYGPGHTITFALELLKQLKGADAAANVAKQLLIA